MNAKLKMNLETSLLSLRVTVFLVMLMWTIDKFVRVEHAKLVFDKFYSLGGMETTIMYVIAAVEVLLLIAFLTGFKKRFSYGLVFLLHFVSTISSFKQYLNPFEGSNLLFFAAWPMLAACFALYILRDYDRRYSLSQSQRHDR